MLFGDAGGNRRVVGLAVALVALTCALSFTATAAAESFLVNSVADETDVVPGDEFCVTAAAKCTLRGAIEESNALGGGDSLDFVEEGLFDGGVGGTIILTKPLPTIEGEIEIFGECAPSGESLRPCVGVDGPGATDPAFSVENTEGVTISGLAITGAGTGIDAVATTRLKVLGSWFGVKLDRSSKGNGTGVLLGPGAHRSLIGNGGEEPNVFAASAEVGLDLSGATNTEVLGNYFGVAPDGVTAATNGKDIEVTGVESGSAGSGTMIGKLLSPEAVATPACDGGCNVISGAASSGIDLEGDGGEEVPATETSIAGNYIGLNASGMVAVANAGDGVKVGRAARTLIGGPRAAEANRFAGGGDSAVRAGPAAPNLVIRGNAIGVGSSGAGLAAPDDGITVTSEGIPSAAEAVIAGNEIRMQGGVAIAQTGLGGWIAGNRISGARIGISTSGYEEHGNLIEGNLIERSELNAILIENELNEVLGNEIFASGGAGIRLHGVDPFFRTFRNRIGGNTEAEENAIFQSGGAAIEIADVEKFSPNEVARNRGSGNRGLFIDLVALSPSTEPKGPNEGITPPLFEAVTDSGVSGSAVPKARVRVFRKAGPSPGELQSFLGEAGADEDGAWTLSFAAPIPAGTAVAATQTGGGGGTSELSFAATPPPAPRPPDACPAAANCPSPPPAKGPPPQTKIFKGPKGKKLVGATAAFKFKASVDGSTFQCKLDGKKFGRCHSPKVYTGLKPGRHRFEVRATGADGQTGAAAKLKFTVLG